MALLLALAFLALWIYVVRSQRAKSLARTLREYKSPLTPLEAQKVLNEYSFYEEPFLYNKSLEFALFKTYSIPTISKLLSATSGLVKTAARRAEDTAVLLTMATFFNLNSEEATLAIARTNYLHSRYGSKISQDDLLYTLSAFVLEPVRWAQKFGWRPMHPLEQEANFVVWRSIGERMQIENIPETQEAFRQWSDAYEKRAMVYADSNKEVADATTEVFLAPLPKSFKPFARRVVYALVPVDMLAAFNYPAQPGWLHTLIKVLFGLRALVIANLLLPISHAASPFEKAANGKYVQTSWKFSPHYVKPSFLNTLAAKLWGYDLSSKGTAETFMQDGFHVADEVGPELYLHKGGDVVKERAAEMRGCPFR